MSNDQLSHVEKPATSAPPDAGRGDGTNQAGAVSGVVPGSQASDPEGHRRPPILTTARRVWTGKRHLWPRVALALVLITVAAFTNRAFLGWGLFVVFGVLFVPVSRARSFVLSFIPYGGVWFIFTAFRSLADETILARTVNLRVAAFERFLFDGQLPTITLQHRFFDPHNLHWWDYYLTGIHWSYFFIPHLVAIRLWQRHPPLFKHYLASMTLLLAVGLGLYFLIPANPPWMAGEQFNSPAAPTVLRVMQPVAENLGGGIYQASYRVIGESNPIAAMPSIHMAITFLLVFPALRFGRTWRLVALFYAASMGLALVYLGEHYVIDIVVGVLVTSYAWYTAGAWRRRLALLSEHQRHRTSTRSRSVAAFRGK